MKFQYTTQEKLWDLRRDHKYTLEYVADAVKISPATLSKYENKENKEYNNATLNKLAQFYGVSLDWLICNTEVKESTLTPIEELRLDDETIEILRTGCFNHRLLCEILKHPDFIHLMTEIEIYVDGHATQKIKNMNDWFDDIRIKLAQKNSVEKLKYCTNILAHKPVNEDKFFINNIHGELDSIIFDLREAHEKDRESMPIEREVTNIDRADKLTELGFLDQPANAFFFDYCEELGIPYDRLTEEELETMLNVFKKSTMFDEVKKLPKEFLDSLG